MFLCNFKTICANLNDPDSFELIHPKSAFTLGMTCLALVVHQCKGFSYPTPLDFFPPGVYQKGIEKCPKQAEYTGA